MKKTYDISRLIPVKPGNTFGLAADTYKTITGVCSAPMNVYVILKGADPVLFQSFSAGRFSFELRHKEDIAFSFEAATAGSEIEISMVAPAAMTRRTGDVEASFTDMSPRPALNPQVAAIMQEMQMLRGQMTSLRLQARQSAPVRPPVAPSEPPAPPPPPDDVVDHGDNGPAGEKGAKA